jgi:hypothetical protein
VGTVADGTEGSSGGMGARAASPDGARPNPFTESRMDASCNTPLRTALASRAHFPQDSWPRCWLAWPRATRCSSMMARLATRVSPGMDSSGGRAPSCRMKRSISSAVGSFPAKVVDPRFVHVVLLCGWVLQP